MTTIYAADASENPPDWLRLSDDVTAAVRDGAPVVALESTVIAQGLPRPRNLDVALGLEDELRRVGIVPATVAVIDGTPRVGIGREEMNRIATDDEVAKLSTRDLPVALARGVTGATTVAATSYLARAAHIDVFATGGIGGVHRGEPLDVSADLEELRRTPIIVVCAGAKSILDLPATREALETLGILVVGWQTDVLPAFYTPSSGLPVDVAVQEPGEVAAIWHAHRRMNAPGAILLCVPVPSAAALPDDLLADVTKRALESANDQGIRGKSLTPFLLQQIAVETNGASLEANIALLRRNTQVAGEVARAISDV